MIALTFELLYVDFESSTVVVAGIQRSPVTGKEEAVKLYVFRIEELQ